MTNESSPQNHQSTPEPTPAATQPDGAVPLADTQPDGAAVPVAATQPDVATPLAATQPDVVALSDVAQAAAVAPAVTHSGVAALRTASADAQTAREPADSISPMSAPIVSIGDDLASMPEQTAPSNSEQTAPSNSEPPAPSARRLSPPPKPKSSYPPPGGPDTEHSGADNVLETAPDKPDQAKLRDKSLEKPTIPEAARVPTFARPSLGSMPPAASFPASRVPRSTTDSTSRPPSTLPAGKSPSRYPWMAPATPDTVIIKPRATRPMRSSPDGSLPFSREPALPPARRTGSQPPVSGDAELPSAPRAAVLPKATHRDSSRPAAGPSSQRPRIVPTQLRKETPTVAIQAMRIIAIGSEDAQNSILPVRPVAGKPRPNAPEASAPGASAPEASAPGASRPSVKERLAAPTPSGSRHEPPPIPDGLLDRAPPRIEPELLEPPHGLELIQLSTTDSASDAQQLLPQPIPDDDVAAIESERSPTSGTTSTDDEAIASGRRRPPPPRRVSFPSGAQSSPETPSTPPSAIGVDPSPSGPIERVPAPVRESAPRQPPPAPSRVPRDPGRSLTKPEAPQRVSIVEGEEAAAARPAGKPEPPQRVSIVEGEEAASVRPAGKPEPPQRVSIVEGEEAPKQRPAPRRLWWDELFGEDFSRAMARLSDAQVDLEVSFIEESLGVAPGAAVLDLGCGAGYHAIELASRGYGVVGYDLSLHQLSLAQEIAQERGQKLNFMQGDMREMAFEEVFDGMYCWNTTFGYFEEEKNVQVAERMFAALKPGGTLLLDVANRDFVAMDQPSSVWYEGDACVCMDDMSVDFFTSRLRVKRSLILDDGRTRECHYSIRLYSLHELGRILHDIGFRVTEASGNPITPGVFLGQNSPRIIILAQKP